ncbi:MAG: hypothetical protein P4L33_20490 [Capsulimonadaceae bacterium]|nr:hypothetical protein [Capsulimonadaceae bacterium]
MKTLIALLIAVLALSAAGASTAGKTLYAFEKNTCGWWTFANNATLKLSCDATTGAGGSTGSLLASYQWLPGQGAYMGLGVQPKWTMAGDAWPNYAKGRFAVSFKSDALVSVRIELRASDKKTYAYTIEGIPSTWKEYAIPFDRFTCGGKGIDLNVADIDQIVVIPQKVNDDPHSLWMDNIAISTDSVKP